MAGGHLDGAGAAWSRRPVRGGGAGRIGDAAPWGPPPVPVLFEGDYLTVERMKIYGGRSRHWVVVWLWFLS
ncbi:hypothetical protein GCM10010446_30120 [Streptomyces enissocaesilis]|uniref:Uncharacterized protein n=1 Tax=Streptomyces enissocaesilis TaxID=332589 RepID=A0ABN3X9F6_9ACTN